jgi:hypothetical protein
MPVMSSAGDIANVEQGFCFDGSAKIKNNCLVECRDVVRL